MFDTPASLQEYCIDYVCDNIAAVCAETPARFVGSSLASPNSEEDEDVQRTPRLMFRETDVFLPCEVAEKLLTTLGEKGKLEDRTLMLFDARVTCLRHVRLCNASRVTKHGLRVLRCHHIIDLEATGLQVTVNELIGCLGEWTLQNLRSLNVANCILGNGTRLCIVVLLTKLRGLHTLNVSNTEFSKLGLEIVVEDLPFLENLDISCTKVSDISPLRQCRDRLKALSMYNLKNCSYNEVIPVVCELHQLRYLDISDDWVDNPFDILAPLRFRVSGLLHKSDCLPHLTYLDISGKEDIETECLLQFLDHHRSLQFLGLAQTEVCYDDMFTEESHPAFRPDLVVTGSGTEAQIKVALERYNSRILYIQKSLYYLFRLTQNYAEPRLDIIQLILPGMKSHPQQIGIQVAATACLYNLSKGEIGKKIHPKWLKKIVELTLVAMENFPSHLQLQKNTLLTLCSDRILQEVTFNKYHCAQLVMDCLCNFEDATMNRMCVAICSILAAKISTEETSLLGAQARYMQKLLTIVRNKMEEGVVDITMKFTLSALWNLTDESPKTCSVFLSEGGLELFLAVLEKFPRESAVETKVLGLVNNIAEVKSLRSALMLEGFVANLRSLLKSSQIDVSYFAAGIVAHLASDGAKVWTVNLISRSHLLDELSDVVLNWKTPNGEMVAYRSFNPFFPLLTCLDSYEVQLWAVWAIQHVCKCNYKRYCPMLVREGGDELLRALLKNPFTNSHVSLICHSILKILDMKGPFIMNSDNQGTY